MKCGVILYVCFGIVQLWVSVLVHQQQKKSRNGTNACQQCRSCQRMPETGKPAAQLQQPAARRSQQQQKCDAKKFPALIHLLPSLAFDNVCKTGMTHVM